MKKTLSDLEVRKIGELNQQLIILEEEIYNLAEQEYKTVKNRISQPESTITDFELDVEILFLKGDDEVLVLNEYMNTAFEGKKLTQINDKQCHNVSGSMIENKVLNTQKHCWLLHRLYDDYFIDWDVILQIDCVWFDIIIHYQYKRNIEGIRL